jgi:hypothetical protein
MVDDVLDMSMWIEAVWIFFWIKRLRFIAFGVTLASN